MPGAAPAAWPYPVRYRTETEAEFDVLVIGGGVAGCHAAINAARSGARVALLDKGAVIRSGSGGAGVDHWHGAVGNPCCDITPEEFVQVVDTYPFGVTSEYGNGITCYIMAKESYETLLDLESMGARVRDTGDEFAGAEFRDDETKLMFAYDYTGRHTLRVLGWEFKPALYRELKRLGVTIFDRVMGTSLLTEGGERGARVVGATAVNVRTGEFRVFRAKATILATAQPLRMWVFSTELQGFAGIHDDPNCAGDGCAMAWNAGAELTLMEKSAPHSGGFRYVAYGTGNAHNTWYACNVVDADGKEVPWVDRDGRLLESFSQRYRPAPGQKYFLYGGRLAHEWRGPSLTADLPERIARGEFRLPLYADLPSMPPDERRALFGLMIGQEGNTRIPIYDVYTQAGFDPDKDLLQAPVLPPAAYGPKPWWSGQATPQWRESAFLVDGGGVVFDWDLRTTLEGLYAAGVQLAGGADHAASATSGRYAGRKAAEYARTARAPLAARAQIDREKTRVYAPLGRTEGVGWKELQAGLCRVMQDYCGEYRSEGTLQLGLEWLDGIRRSELARAHARNPHELMRTLECGVRLTVGEVMMHASLARKASSDGLCFKRIDYPDVDPPEWDKLVTIRQDGSAVKTRDLPWDYWRRAPYAPLQADNYAAHCGREGDDPAAGAAAPGSAAGDSAADGAEG
jgi:succinate dehydrogenase/fumarate reductase flavoprotein subunit